MEKMWQERKAWLARLPLPAPEALKTPLEAAEFEIGQAGVRAVFTVEKDGGESYEILPEDGGYRIVGGETGVLSGAYALIRGLAAGHVPAGRQRPFYPLRMLNCWDNMDGTVERGYAGRSMWFEGGRFDYEPARIRQLGRMLASCGVNVLCVNNVNVHQPAQHLTDTLLPDLARFAALLRPFGVRLMICIDFSLPLQHGLATADPLDEQVQAWWKERAKEIWAAVPDLAGFLVKADSEHRPGPSTYGRTHAEGANMLARAVAPFGGVLVWRAFVYNCMQDWRDTKTDRPRAAYDLYKPLDGQFDGNVIVQVKYGPFDFQVREPVSPLLLGMEKTNLSLELQLAQEYTGHQIDLFAMPPLWREIFDGCPGVNGVNLIDLLYYLPDDGCRKEGLAAEYAGVKAFSPLLDMDVVRFALTLPIDCRLSIRRGKLLLRHIGREYLPDEILHQVKRGFGMPVSAWLRKELKPYAAELPDKLDAFGCFSKSFVRRMVNEHFAGAADHGPKLWALICCGEV